MGLHQLPRLRLNAVHKLVRVGLPLGDLGQTAFPFSGKLGRSECIRQHHSQIDAVLGGNELLAFSLDKAHLHQLFQNGGAGGRGSQSFALGVLRHILGPGPFHSGQQRIFGKILSRVVKKNLHCLCHVISIC